MKTNIKINMEKAVLVIDGFFFKAILRLKF